MKRPPSSVAFAMFIAIVAVWVAMFMHTHTDGQEMCNALAKQEEATWHSRSSERSFLRARGFREDTSRVSWRYDDEIDVCVRLVVVSL